MLRKITSGNVIHRIPLLAYSHPIVVLVALSIIGVVAAYHAKNLSLDADINALLPDSFVSVQDFKTVKDYFGGVGYVVVTVRGENPEAMRLMADEIAKKTQPLDNISFVDYRRPVDFFSHRILYYLDVDDLNAIEKRIKKRWKWEKRKRNPMYVDLEGDEAPSLEFNDLQKKYKSKNNSSWMSAQHSDEAYYFNRDKNFLAVFVKPEITSSNFELSAKTVRSIQNAIDEIDINAFGPSLKLEITGYFKKKIDVQEEMITDIGFATLISLGLVLSYLLLHFRRLEAIFLISLPLIFGIVCTFSFASLVFGQLNILTAFIGVILLGLGIDHGIHLLSRYRDEACVNEDKKEVLHQTFIRTGKSVAIAALTTFVIFIGLSVSEFRAFYEFGIIASAGMIFIMASYLVIMPALLGLLNAFTPNFYSIKSSSFDFSFLTNLHTKRFHQIIVISFVLILFAGYKAKDLTFNYDFESLGSVNIASFILDKEVNDLLGYSQTPMLMLTNTLDEEYFVAEQFRENQERLGNESGVDFLLATTDMVPVDQEIKQKILEKILKRLGKVKESWLEGEEPSHLEELKNMLKAKPFTYSDLPVEIQQFFGSHAEGVNSEGAIMLFPAIQLSDGDKVMALANELRNVKQLSGDRVVIAGESMILADILTLTFQEAPKILSLSLLLVFGVLWFFLKRLDYTLIALAPAVFALVLTLGVMAAFRLELNYINIIMIPILLGISVDSGVHMVNRAIDHNPLPRIINETGFAIFGSIVTSGLGFSALLFTNHPGLNSLAYIGVIGLTMSLFVSIFILPSMIQMKISSSTIQQARLQHAS